MRILLVDRFSDIGLIPNTEEDIIFWKPAGIGWVIVTPKSLADKMTGIYGEGVYHSQVKRPMLTIKKITLEEVIADLRKHKFVPDEKVKITHVKG